MEQKKSKESLSQFMAASVETGLTPSNNSSVYGTHSTDGCKLRLGDRKIVENLRDSRRKNELITGRRIPIDIYKGENEVRGKIYSESLKKG